MYYSYGSFGVTVNQGNTTRNETSLIQCKKTNLEPPGHFLFSTIIYNFQNNVPSDWIIQRKNESVFHIAEVDLIHSEPTKLTC